MKINSLSVLFFCILCTACGHNQKIEVERLSLAPVEVAHDLESMMPGQLLLSDNYILWTDPFHSEKFIHILNRTTGEEIGQMLSKGNGPDELISPNISVLPEDKILAFDVNMNKKMLLSIENALQQKNEILQKQTGDYATTTRMISLGQHDFISFTPSNRQPFLFFNEQTDDSHPFGSLPVEENVNNAYDVFQGSLAWHPIRKCLVYTTFRLPYMAVYTKKHNRFEIENTRMENKDYQIIEGNFKYNNPEHGAQELTLTADYIVTIQRDRTVDQTDENRVGRDFTKLPHTVFLYNYKLQLLKIIDLGIPLLRLASDPTQNTVYAIGINPDFTLVK
ncbi:MAG: hypothetical protein LBR10_00125, partial [Prevotellaceae bacterium]|nr:hypothetical protein [Prevotellaceae bacterium]